ncbi:MAG: zinc ribbon domain-containing protein [Treponema sp.]|nr:zinc ribbon domain-containing protein [Treponema sp.]
MKSVTVCRGCGRTIDNDFIYCPWCGYSRVACDDNASLNAVFNQLEQLQSDSCSHQISKMEKQLDELEHELDTLVLSAEMHK